MTKKRQISVAMITTLTMFSLNNCRNAEDPGSGPGEGPAEGDTAIISFIGTGVSAVEGGQVNVAVQLDQALLTDVTASITAAGDADATDYTLDTTSVVIPAGATTANILVNLLTPGETVTEFIELSLTNPIGATLGFSSTFSIEITRTTPAGGPSGESDPIIIGSIDFFNSEKHSIYIYDGKGWDGDFKEDCDGLSARNCALETCKDRFDNELQGKVDDALYNRDNVAPFASFKSYFINNMPEKYGFNPNGTVISKTHKVVANTFTNLAKGELVSTLKKADVLGLWDNALFWTGATEDGGDHETDCSDFTTDSENVNGRVGHGDKDGSDFLDYDDEKCSKNDGVNLVCIAFVPDTDNSLVVIRE